MLIEMSKQEADEFALWLRERANSYIQRADRIQRSRVDRPQNGVNHTPKSVSTVPPATTLTQSQFEESVMTKSGRVYDVAKRFNVNEAVIYDFLRQPNIRVSVQGRGWIKAKP